MTGAPGPGPIRVLIADDQRVVRDGLSMLVALIDDVEVVGTACDGAEAVRLAEEHRPDVVLMDLRMPGTDGIAATADLRQRLPSTRVLVLTTYADEDAIVPALQAGARGYLTKDASAEQIEAAIRAVHAGQTHLDPAVQERLVAAVISRPPAAGPAGPGPGQKPPGGLTAREAEVLTLLGGGAEQRRDRHSASTSATPRSRPTSTGSSPRPAPATGPRPSGTPTSTAWPPRFSDTAPSAAGEWCPGEAATQRPVLDPGHAQHAARPGAGDAGGCHHGHLPPFGVHPATVSLRLPSRRRGP